MREAIIGLGGRAYPFSPEMLGSQLAADQTNPWLREKKEKQNSDRRVNALPFAGRKLIDEAPFIIVEGTMFHEVNDAYSVTGVHPETLDSYAACAKIDGVWRDGSLYVNIASVDDFHRRIGRKPSFFRLRLTFIHLLIYFN